jgi:hypothetical protein
MTTVCNVAAAMLFNIAHSTENVNRQKNHSSF